MAVIEINEEKYIKLLKPGQCIVDVYFNGSEIVIFDVISVKRNFSVNPNTISIQGNVTEILTGDVIPIKKTKIDNKFKPVNFKVFRDMDEI